MSNKSLLLAVVIAVAPCSLLFSGDITFPSGNFFCKVEMIPRKASPAPDSNAEAPPSAKKRQITKSGNIRRDVVTWSDNSTSEYWSLANEKLAVSEENGPDGKKHAYVLQGSMKDGACPEILSFSSTAYPWVKMENLVKEEGASATSPLHYKTTITTSAQSGEVLGESGGESKSIVLEAWIDPKTQIPIKLADDEFEYVLTFQTEPPITPLQIPGHLQAELDRWKKALAPRAHL